MIFRWKSFSRKKRSCPSNKRKKGFPKKPHRRSAADIAAAVVAITVAVAVAAVIASAAVAASAGAVAIISAVANAAAAEQKNEDNDDPKAVVTVSAEHKNDPFSAHVYFSQSVSSCG